MSFEVIYFWGSALLLSGIIAIWLWIRSKRSTDESEDEEEDECSACN